MYQGVLHLGQTVSSFLLWFSQFDNDRGTQQESLFAEVYQHNKA